MHEPSPQELFDLLTQALTAANGSDPEGLPNSQSNQVRYYLYGVMAKHFPERIEFVRLDIKGITREDYTVRRTQVLVGRVDGQWALTGTGCVPWDTFVNKQCRLMGLAHPESKFMTFGCELLP